MQTTEFFFPGNLADGALTMAVKRYTPVAVANNRENAEAVSMLFTHNVGTHKETWQPTIERLFELQAATLGSKIFIAEAWVIDSPNHGHAGVLNERAFLERPNGISAHECGRGVQTLFNSGLMRAGIKCIGVGHSAGACVIVLSTMGYHVADLPLASIILIEPAMLTQEIAAKAVAEPAMAMVAVIKAAQARRDVWASRDEAEQYFRRRLPWSRWLPAVLQQFVEHGLKNLPSLTHPGQTNGVTLACTKTQEIAGYVYYQDGMDAMNRFEEIAATIPTHCILGSEIDVVPEAVHNACIEAGRSSVQRIAGAGHLVVQEKPAELASAIWRALKQTDFEPVSARL
ncbi:alpha/beta-hydrolase [Auriscalpium vulgare]|uniref:Alpha/beta-hydrolase n=1 Tax=Auriscalpium vulgare TaxID=40419 RepID=A0ACB8RUH1_9AGAM|nr:alpha/beta-hydrolase [Auriscalpium vulgare]